MKHSNKENLDNAMTIRDLIKQLLSYEPITKVGKIGDFGEFHAMTRYDFSLRYLNDEKQFVLDITPPNIGEEPD